MTDNKRELVLAHRRGDWERAAELSAERQRLKRRTRRCEVCDVVLSKLGRFCFMHSIIHRHYRSALAFLLAICAAILAVCARGQTFEWDAPDITAGIEAYSLYWSRTPGSFNANNRVVIPFPTGTATVTNCGAGTLYFVVRSATSEGLESSNSNQVVVTNTPPAPFNLRVKSAAIGADKQSVTIAFEVAPPTPLR